MSDDIEKPQQLQHGDGMSLEVGKFYRKSPVGIWEEWDSVEVPEDKPASPESPKRAIVVYRERLPPDPTLRLHAIVIQSPLLRKVLDRTFEGYDGISTKLKELRFTPPLHEFYYRWHKLEMLIADEEDDTTTKHLKLFYPVISKEVLPYIERMQDLTRNGVITFDYLWTIFPSGTKIYTNIDGQDRIFIATSSTVGYGEGGKRSFQIQCQYIDCDGTKFVRNTSTQPIREFKGVKEITKLEVFPAHLHPDPQGLLEKLCQRGEQFEKLNGFHHMSYSGFYFDRIRGKKRHTDESHIIIDANVFSQRTVGNIHGPHSVPASHVPPPRPVPRHVHRIPSFGCGIPPMLPHGSPSPYASLSQEVEPERIEQEEEDTTPPLLDMFHQATEKTFRTFDGILKGFGGGKSAGKEEATSLTPELLILCTPVVKGLCLKSKSWAEFNVDNVFPITWSDQAFSRLVLPYGNKEIIHAFVEEQLSQHDDFDDIVRGKGQGFIMLLTGEPGVGKTLTAESVSEQMRKPLYSMSAGELGEDAYEVESALEQVLQLTANWRAILLLDECDIFLEQRGVNDIRRNRLVSIFLKHLEYFQGVMFLTTNRASAIDAAFESRIHLTLEYPALDEQSRLHVWRNFMEPADHAAAAVVHGSNLSDEHLARFAKVKLNGRQIKNVVKTARLLAKQKKRALEKEDVELVLKVRMKVDG